MCMLRSLPCFFIILISVFVCDEFDFEFQVDKQTNNLIILLFFLLIVLCLIMAVCNSQWDANLHWYLSIDGEYTWKAMG